MLNCIILPTRVCNWGHNKIIIENFDDTHGHGDQFSVTGV